MIYYLASFWCFTSALLIDVNSKGPLVRPVNDAPLKIAGAIGVIGTIVLIVLGVIYFEWWYPLAGFGSALIVSHLLCSVTGSIMPIVIGAIALDLIGSALGVIAFL